MRRENVGTGQHSAASCSIKLLSRQKMSDSYLHGSVVTSDPLAAAELDEEALYFLARERSKNVEFGNCKNVEECSGNKNTYELLRIKEIVELN